MYLVLVTLAAVGVLMAASAAITALVRSLAERKASEVHKPVALGSKR
ncbi:MAG TPA: hypothetical protein VEF05_11880 [Terriglobales bacterium]|nr:hypothetical protein [Terriglobales bacterium]